MFINTYIVEPVIIERLRRLNLSVGVLYTYIYMLSARLAHDYSGGSTRPQNVTPCPKDLLGSPRLV